MSEAHEMILVDHVYECTQCPRRVIWTVGDQGIPERVVLEHGDESLIHVGSAPGLSFTATVRQKP